MATPSQTENLTSNMEETQEPLTLEEAQCPICFNIRVKPILLPCHHEVCMPCFEGLVANSTLECPMCRKSIRHFCRTAFRDLEQAVNNTSWHMIQNTFPEECKKRLRGEENELSEEEMRIPRPILSSQGEIRQEYLELCRRDQEEREKERRKEEELSQEEIARVKQEEELNLLSEIEKRDMELAGQLEKALHSSRNESVVTRSSSRSSSSTSERSLDQRGEKTRRSSTSSNISRSSSVQYQGSRAPSEGPLEKLTPDSGDDEDIQATHFRRTPARHASSRCGVRVKLEPESECSRTASPEYLPMPSPDSAAEVEQPVPVHEPSGSGWKAPKVETSELSDDAAFIGQTSTPSTSPVVRPNVPEHGPGDEKEADALIRPEKSTSSQDSVISSSTGTPPVDCPMPQPEWKKDVPHRHKRPPSLPSVLLKRMREPPARENEPSSQTAPDDLPAPASGLLHVAAHCAAEATTESSESTTLSTSTGACAATSAGLAGAAPSTGTMAAHGTPSGSSASVASSLGLMNAALARRHCVYPIVGSMEDAPTAGSTSSATTLDTAAGVSDTASVRHNAPEQASAEPLTEPPAKVRKMLSVEESDELLAKELQEFENMRVRYRINDRDPYGTRKIKFRRTK